MKSIAIFGAGGLGMEVLSLIQSLSEWSPVGFYDDNITKGTFIHGLEVLGGINDLLRSSEQNLSLIIAVGDPLVKAKLVNQLKKCEAIDYPTVIHPNAIIMDKSSIKIGAGSIICAGSILTTEISIGKHVLINLNVTVGHNTELGDYCSVMPGVNLAGSVHLGNEVLIGSGANIRNSVQLGDRCKIGMGAVVLKDIASGATAVGVPAKVVKIR
jgi:sugar O-acyltransferase (sialic acid O-acetyltransferase NeuD family)